MAESSKTTRDHDEIRQWAEERGGKPAHVSETGSKGDIGILRLEFPGAPGASDATLEPITWEQFFEKFDERGLALLCQEETAEGTKSNFNKLVSAATTADAGEPSDKAPAKKRAGAGGAAKSAVTARKSGSAAKKAPAKKTTASRKAAKKSASKKKIVPPKTKRATAGAKRGGSTAKKAVKKSASSKRARGAAKAVKKVSGRKQTAKKIAKKTARKAAARKRR